MDRVWFTFSRTTTETRLQLLVRRSEEPSARATPASVRRLLPRSISPAKPSTILPLDRPIIYRPGTLTFTYVPSLSTNIYRHALVSIEREFKPMQCFPLKEASKTLTLTT